MDEKIVPLTTFTDEMTTPSSTPIDRLLAMAREPAAVGEVEPLVPLPNRMDPSVMPCERRANERELWTRAARRRRQAIDELIRSHGHRLRRYLLGMLGPAAPVDDLVQETFITALDSIDNLRADAEPSTWLHGIARNLARNWRRKEQHRARLILETPQVEARIRGRQPDDPEREHDHRRSLARMRTLLAELPETEHEAFVLRHLAGHNLTEVASLQNVAISTASARVQRAEQALRRAMKAGTP